MNPDNSAKQTAGKIPRITISWKDLSVGETPELLPVCHTFSKLQRK
jgi:hypothetical protein